MHETPDQRRELRPESLAMLRRFEAETARGDGVTAITYRRRIEAALGRFQLVGEQEPLLEELVCDARVLAIVIGLDVSRRSGKRLAASTIHGTSDAFRALIAWMPASDRSERRRRMEVLDEALMSNSTVRGRRRKLLPGHRDVARRSALSRREIETIIRELRLDPDPLSGVAADLAGFLSLTGIRVGAALSLKRSELVRGPGDRWCIVIREKSRPQRRLVVVRSPNRAVLLRRWEPLAEHAPLWQRGGLTLTEKSFRRLLSAAASRAAIEGKVVPHQIRHSFATDAVRAVGFATAKRAGNWVSDDVAQSYMH